MHFEFELLRTMRKWTKNCYCDRAMPYITKLGDYGILWILLALILLCFKRQRHAAWTLLFSLAIESILCNGLLKPLVNRSRPFEIAPDIQPLIPPPKDRSFPSGHTGSSIAAATGLYLAGSSLWKAALPIALLITWSRLYLCVHFVTDILGGIGAGILSAFAGHSIVNRFDKRR